MKNLRNEELEQILIDFTNWFRVLDVPTDDLSSNDIAKMYLKSIKNKESSRIYYL